jgi:hypothetical protein
MSKFKVGDKVQMKSGGQVGIVKMVGCAVTVKNVRNGHGFNAMVLDKGVAVQWPASKRINTQYESNLVLADPPKRPTQRDPRDSGLVPPNSSFNRAKR